MKVLIAIVIIVLSLISLESCHLGSSPTGPVEADTTQVD
jgi:hypothetical protein